jgi:hypothetical protein
LTAAAGVDLYWLPLGAGGRFVRFTGRVYERICARLGRREARDIYHAALEVHAGGETYVIEQTPVPDLRGSERGVVASGAVGARWAGRARSFRYEVRVWRGGSIPDIAEAVESPRRLSSDGRVARRVLDVAPGVPTPVWGRDQLRTGEMWNSNAVIAWILKSAGIDADGVRPPAGGRAPGWGAGLVAAGPRGRGLPGPTGRGNEVPEPVRVR